MLRTCADTKFFFRNITHAIFFPFSFQRCATLSPHPNTGVANACPAAQVRLPTNTRDRSYAFLGNSLKRRFASFTQTRQPSSDDVNQRTEKLITLYAQSFWEIVVRTTDPSAKALSFADGQ